MSKRTVFTTVTPLPSYINRQTVIDTLHDHKEMIELNPLVIHHERCRPATNATADEFHCIWYELTDRVSYLPGGVVTGKVSYKACFHDLPTSLQTHVYAPAGLDIKEKWSVCGNMPGEPREPVELGLANAPREGLYLREDVDMRCNILMTAFVKKTLKRAHQVLVDRLIFKADLLKERQGQASVRHSMTSPSLYSSHSGPRSLYSASEVSGGADLLPRHPSVLVASSSHPTAAELPNTLKLSEVPEVLPQGYRFDPSSGALPILQQYELASNEDINLAPQPLRLSLSGQQSHSGRHEMVYEMP